MVLLFLRNYSDIIKVRMVIFFFIAVLVISVQLCTGTTAVDRLEKLMQGNSKVIVGALYGSVETIRVGYGEGGVATSTLTEIMGEKIMKLGSAYHDFPVATALHIAISQGKKEHLDCAFFLMKTGANINSFIMPSVLNAPLTVDKNEIVFTDVMSDLLVEAIEEDSLLDVPSIGNRPQTMSEIYFHRADKADTVDLTTRRAIVRATAPYNISVRGYPPALLYGLGLGAAPTNQHAAMLQRLYHTFPSNFNMTKIQEWCDATGNLPLLNMVVGLGFFDGLYVLVNDFKLNVNEYHGSGVSALHVAVWEGRIDMAGFLLHHGANMHAVDSRGRSPLHYSAIRGFRDMVSLMYQHSTNMHEFCKLLSSVDYNNRSAIDLAMNTRPRQTLYAVELGLLVQYMCNINYQSLILPPSSGTPSKRQAVRSASFTMPPRCVYSSGWMDASEVDVEEVAPDKDDRILNTIDVIDSSEWYSDADKRGFDNDDQYLRSVASAAVKHIYRDYITTQRPVLIKGGERITARQRIWSQWDVDGFNNRYGGLLLKRGEELFFDYYVNLDSRFYRHSYMTGSGYKAQERCISEWLLMMRYDKEYSSVNSSVSCVNDDGSLANNRWNSPWEVQATDPIMVSTGEVYDRLEKYQSSIAEPVYDQDRVADSRIQWKEEVVEQQRHRDEILFVNGGGSANSIRNRVDDAPRNPSENEPKKTKSILKEDIKAPFIFDKICTTTVQSSISKKFGLNSSHSVQKNAAERDVYTEPYTLSLGPANTSYPMHAHNSSWHILITGKKRWYMMSPGHSMYAFSTKEQIDEMGLLKPSTLSNSGVSEDPIAPSGIKQFIMPVPEWFEKYGNYLVSIGLVSVFDQYPGDLVYVPHNWAYSTHNLADSVSISQEICTFAHTDQRVYPIGSALYGGKDKYRRYNYPLLKMRSSKISNSNNNPFKDIDQSVPIFPH